MTKEALEKEAEEYAKEALKEFKWKFEVVKQAFIDSAQLREKQILELEQQIEQLQKINSEQKETLKKVRVALIQERAANIINYVNGGVEMFDSLFELLKGVSN